ncbi:MAG: hypothetical protein DMF80_12435 [Acidobacteria bacterium]|nr:MAG: hypothetical protein DMF80_12435 [Acidobacteriota bacterium]PYQ22414.1 MAG: hypothetical protein DMF81_12165 [Acidobacteriota bacterium]
MSHSRREPRRGPAGSAVPASSSRARPSRRSDSQTDSTGTACPSFAVTRAAICAAERRPLQASHTAAATGPRQCAL